MSVLDEIATERKRQDKKWGEQNHWDSYWLAILTEEVGEVARCVCDGNNLAHMRQELVQVAAVAVAWVEAFDRAAEKTLV